MGKLYRQLERGLEPGQKMLPLLRGAGIPKGTVSSASYAAKVFDLVEQSVITEGEFDALSFADVVAIRRVMSAHSRRVLGGGEVARLMREHPATWQDECQSLFSTGFMRGERSRSAPAGDGATTDGDESVPVSRAPRRESFQVARTGPRDAGNLPPSDSEPSDDPREELGRLLDLAQRTLLDVREAIVRLRGNHPADVLVTAALGPIGRLRLSLNEGAL